MIEWWSGAALGILLLILIGVIGTRQRKAKANELLRRRANVSRQEFIDLLTNDASADIAEFLWDELEFYCDFGLKPHPDDDFIKDLGIDDEEPNDWLERYCAARGHNWEQWPEWNPDQSTTVRNFAVWLFDGPFTDAISPKSRPS